MSKKDSGTEPSPYGLPQMSLRDWLAGLAMQAYVAKESPASDEDGDFVAEYAYEIADWMLKERAKRVRPR